MAQIVKYLEDDTTIIELTPDKGAAIEIAITPSDKWQDGTVTIIRGGNYITMSLTNFDLLTKKVYSVWGFSHQFPSMEKKRSWFSIMLYKASSVLKRLWQSFITLMDNIRTV